MKIGRWSELHGVPEVRVFPKGTDFRLPQHRRETFLRFWEFHLRHRSHPGCVYYLLPELARVHGWTQEQKLWFAYVNGNTQNPVTSWLIFKEFPDVLMLDEFALADWFNANYSKLAFDTDRRYHKSKFLACVSNYRALLAGRTQAEFFRQMTVGLSPAAAFGTLWSFCLKHYVYFGRLSVFSYLEYTRIMGLPIDCDRLFLDDISGSKSHRNGLCKVLGRDDLDWHDSNPGFDGSYTPTMIRWLQAEGALLLDEMRARAVGQHWESDVSYFTMESALCTYKSWHRPNRRYANVYNDMLVGRIQEGERAMGLPLEVFWAIRRAVVPGVLRLEDNPADCGVKPPKQNWYREHGCPVMLGHDYPDMWSAWDEDVRIRQAG